MRVWLDRVDGVLAIPVHPAEPGRIRDTLVQVQVPPPAPSLWALTHTPEHNTLRPRPWVHPPGSGSPRVWVQTLGLGPTPLGLGLDPDPGSTPQGLGPDPGSTPQGLGPDPGSRPSPPGPR